MQHSKPYLIVVGVDYSKTGDLALERAFELATERENAEVHIVYVLQTLSALAPVELGVGIGGPDPSLVKEASEQLRKYAERKLDEFKSKFAGTGKKRLFERAVSHLRLDAPAQEVAQLAADLEADLVVVGTHGRKGATRLLVGSVAEGVVRLAPCPVLVVREKRVHEEGPKIEPPCPDCLEIRRTSNNKELWCARHREHHIIAHTYHYRDRVGEETNFPMVTPER
ncbi:MAG TPA: universal stress protein [Polyangiaceae bacterium]|nr:universal stress protein [Polyangiaceae bacterium]